MGTNCEAFLGSWCGGLDGFSLGSYDGYLSDSTPEVNTGFRDRNLVGQVLGGRRYGIYRKLLLSEGW